MTLTVGNWAIRRDRNAVAVFNRDTGTKGRVAFGAYTKTSRPELVDIKITDWCGSNCSYCYQGSTVEGSHASVQNMVTVIERLAAAGVFEVALGGGEPTAHPEFINILRWFCEAGIVPNFTTKQAAVTNRLWPEIAQYVGAFAYSAETSAQIMRAHQNLTDVPSSSVVLHKVMGLNGRDEFVNYMRTAHSIGWKVTLLGYKTTGRGKLAVHEDYGWWIDAINDLIRAGECPSFSIDTPMAADYNGLMPVDSRMFHTREGAFSAYIDAVSMEMGASSFDPSEMLSPFNSGWLTTYAGL